MRSGWTHRSIKCVTSWETGNISVQLNLNTFSSKRLLCRNVTKVMADYKKIIFIIYLMFRRNAFCIACLVFYFGGYVPMSCPSSCLLSTDPPPTIIKNPSTIITCDTYEQTRWASSPAPIGLGPRCHHPNTRSWSRCHRSVERKLECNANS